MDLRTFSRIPLKFIRANCKSFATTSEGAGAFSDCSRNGNIKIVVAMSGGVDSSVAAYLLQNLSQKSAGTTESDIEEGEIKVVGLHMSNWNALDEDTDYVVDTSSPDRDSEKFQSKMINRAATARQRTPSNSTFCEASEKEYGDSQLVARHLSMPLQRVSFASEYWIQVFEPFVESLSVPAPMLGNDNTSDTCGELTMPNPDFNCNTFIKFGSMQDYAVHKLGANFVATGHYAQLWHRGCDFSMSNKQNYSRFFEWMTETSVSLQRKVHESLAGRPEEEWLLSNCSESQNNSHIPILLAGADRSKDQTYFLSGVKTERFRNVIFPLGHLAKKHFTGPRILEDSPNDHPLNNIDNQLSVRDIAIRAKIPTASKKESMGICFIGKRNFGQFVSQYLPDTPAPGNFVDVDTGEIVGHHLGSMHYTIGQGAKISGRSTKYFVCGKGVTGRSEDNTVFVCNDTHHPSLYTDELYVDFNTFNWIGLGEIINNNKFGHVPYPLIHGQTIELLARTRHLQPLAPCSVTWQKHHSDYGGSPSLGMLLVKFHRPMRAITPGQIVALYAGSDGLICLGGGPIHRRGKSLMECGLEVPLSMLHPSGHNDLSLIRT